MKKLTLILFFLFIIKATMAAKLEDVKILSTNLSENGIKLKLQLKEASHDSYFFVDITKDDEKSFEKMALIMKKIKTPHTYKLDLDIPGFSKSPKGSYYRSAFILFEGKAK